MSGSPSRQPRPLGTEVPAVSSPACRAWRAAGRASAGAQSPPSQPGGTLRRGWSRGCSAGQGGGAGLGSYPAVEPTLEVSVLGKPPVPALPSRLCSSPPASAASGEPPAPRGSPGTGWAPSPRPDLSSTQYQRQHPYPTEPPFLICRRGCRADPPTPTVWRGWTGPLWEGSPS